MQMFTGVRKDHPEWERLSVQVGRGVLVRFNRTISSFYERCQEGKKPGFPRFKSSRRWRSIERGGSSRKGHAHFIVEAVNRTRRAGATGA